MYCEAAAIITSHRAEIELEKIICMKSAPKVGTGSKSPEPQFRVSFSNTHGRDAVNENTLGDGRKEENPK